jgi:hypothetical protein
MKLMTVKEYAKREKKSIPLIYKKIRENTLKWEKKFGKYLIKTKCVLVCLFFLACSSENDPEPLGYGCAQLRQDANNVCKASIANPNDKALAAQCSQLAGEVSRKRCP